MTPDTRSGLPAFASLRVEPAPAVDDRRLESLSVPVMIALGNMGAVVDAPCHLVWGTPDGYAGPESVGRSTDAQRYPWKQLVRGMGTGEALTWTVRDPGRGGAGVLLILDAGEGLRGRRPPPCGAVVQSSQST